MTLSDLAIGGIPVCESSNELTDHLTTELGELLVAPRVIVSELVVIES